MNTELFKKINDIVRLTPEKFSMNTWADKEDESCGTTRCLAGWAVHLTTGEPLFNADGEEHSSVHALAEEMGLPVYFEILGRELLKLSRHAAGKVFYINDEDATEFIRLAALGRDAEALEWLENVEE